MIWISIHSGRLCCGHLLNKSLNLFHVLNRDSVSTWVIEGISCLSLVVLLGGKYQVRNASTSYSHLVIEARGSTWSNWLARPFSEHGNNLNCMTSTETLFIFSISLSSKNPPMWLLVPSYGYPWICIYCWTICKKASFKSKLFIATCCRMILYWDPFNVSLA